MYNGKVNKETKDKLKVWFKILQSYNDVFLDISHCLISANRSFDKT